MRFVLWRFLYSLFLLVAVSFLSFLLVDLAPGEFLDALRLDPHISPATLRSLRTQYGLDQPLPIKYLHWLRSVLDGEWGFSFAYNSPAGAILWPRAWNTLLLTGTATLLAWLVAIPFGTWSVAERGRSLDLLASGTIAALLVFPDIVLALLLLLFAVRSGYFPVGGMVSLEFHQMDLWAKSRDLAGHLLLPCLCLAAGLLPLLLSHVRSALKEVLDSPYIAAARAHGIKHRRLLFRHALPAAANPLISLFGFSIGLLLSSSLLIEGIFSWPGLGQLLIEAIVQRDLYLVVDTVTLGTLFLVGGNLVADILLYAVDPRIRTH